MKSKAIVALGTLALAAGAFLAVPTASNAAPPLRIATPNSIPGNNQQTVGPAIGSTGVTPGTSTGDTGAGGGANQPVPSPSPTASGSPTASPAPSSR